VGATELQVRSQRENTCGALEVPLARRGLHDTFATRTAKIFATAVPTGSKNRLVDAGPKRTLEGLNRETNLPERRDTKEAL